MWIKRIAIALLLMPFSGAAESPLPSPGFQIAPYTVDLNRTARPHQEPYTGPLIDTHVHLLRGLKGRGISDVADQVDEAGISRMIVLPTPNEGRMRHKEGNADKRRKWVQIGGAKAARLCGSTYFTYWMHGIQTGGFSKDDLERRIDRLRKDLVSGGCLGIGEIGPYHFDKKSGMGILRTPLNFEPMLRLVDLAAELDVWLDVHLEPRAPQGNAFESEVFGGIALWYQRQPDLKLILSHTGMTSPANARHLLEVHPNLMMNMKQVNPDRRIKWDHLGRISNRADQFFEDWARLFEAYPDRFMVGTDARFGEKWFNNGRYLKMVKAMRLALGSLDGVAAAKIAYKNAQRVFGTD